MKPLQKTKVAVIIPAHNEELGIEKAVLGMLNQSYVLDKIIVVDDRSTDSTPEILKTLQYEIPQLTVISNKVSALRAGAINAGLERLPNDIDLVITADADNVFHKDIAREAVKTFLKTGNEKLAGICSIAGVQKPDLTQLKGIRKLVAWFMWRYQRLEYAGFDATRTANWDNVLILHGLCSVFRVKAIKQVGGYSPSVLLEDYDLTLRLKMAGWKTQFNPRMKAWTKVPLTLKAYFRQRLRWSRGGVDVLMKYGLNKHTWWDIFNHVLFILFFLGLSVYIGAITSVHGWKFMHFQAHPLPITLAVIGYLFGLYKLKFLDKIELADLLLRVTVVLELVMAMLMSGLQLVSYALAITKSKQKW